jgi:Tannase and feruloyl esterase
LILVASRRIILGVRMPGACTPESSTRRTAIHRRIAFACLLVVPLAVAVFAPRASAQRSCDSLTGLQLSHAKITSAASVAAGTFKPPAAPGAPPINFLLPAFCRVQAVATPTSDSDIRFEVWLPASGWNGKFEQVGNGAFAGAIPLSSMALPLYRGYATAATDDGHQANPASAAWAVGHPEKVIDFGYRAVHEVSLQSKAIVAAFYGKHPKLSYFVGCSDGGREALMEAQRFSADFRGIIAGAPANNWTRLSTKGLWDERALSQPGAWIPPAKLKVLQDAALSQCDSRDGLKDGLIENPELCPFNPKSVECKGADAAGCLTAPQVEAARKIYGPAVNSETGAEIYPGFSPGAEANPANWLIWITGAQSPKFTVQALIANSFFTDMVFGKPQMNVDAINFGSDFKLAGEKIGSIIDSASPDLRTFQSRGGKLIQYAGWGDAAIPPQGSVDYFKSVQAEMGDTKNFYRLFMVPGMSHCGGGEGANSFGNAGPVPDAAPSNDVVMAMDRWVTKNVAPGKIIATRYVDNNPAKGVQYTRPLCPYPAQAHYNGGDPNSASSFSCAVPPALAKH